MKNKIIRKLLQALVAAKRIPTDHARRLRAYGGSQLPAEGVGAEVATPKKLQIPKIFLSIVSKLNEVSISEKQKLKKVVSQAWQIEQLLCAEINNPTF